MAEPPGCAGLGRQCRELAVTLRIADLAEDAPGFRDAAATWLLGHTQRITFGRPYVQDDALVTDATIHVRCKHLGETRGANGERPHALCTAHNFTGPLPRGTGPGAASRPTPQPGNGSFRIFYHGRERTLDLPLKRARRALPVVSNGHNPCAGAPCRTADNTRGAACCRDLTLDVVLPDGEDPHLEALLRSRQSPYLCKVSRTNPTTVECEVISACGYLDPADGVSCVLHGRLLPNRRLAKPSICREWPDLDDDEVAHPGCRLAKTR